jgi:peptidoglycan/xylan/chitin deacetylase (PgdA/CDA1 family)
VLLLALLSALVGAAIRPDPVVFWLRRRFPDVLFHVETDEPLVALTIDDSPHPMLTRRILEVLAAHEARATFFVIGERVPGNEALLQRLVDAGHEVGNHLMADAPSVRLPAAEFARQLRQMDDLLAPFGPVAWVRPGHGWFNRRMLKQIRAHGQRCALASAYSVEGRFAPVGYAAWHILLNIRPGAVIVLHDGAAERERTVAVLARILPELRGRGYRVVPLAELAARAVPRAGRQPPEVRRRMARGGASCGAAATRAGA